MSTLNHPCSIRVVFFIAIFLLYMEEGIVIKENASIPEIVSWIKKYAIEYSADPTVKAWSEECRKSDDPVRCVFNRAYDAILYVPDPINRQRIRTVENVLRTRRGNCATYCQLIGGMLINLGIPFRLKVISMYPLDDPDFEWHHVYVVTQDGIALDPVIGQRQDGTDTRENRPSKGQFNKENYYASHLIYPMARLEILQGTLGRRYPTMPPVIMSRSRLSRMGVLNGCGCGCNDCNDQLGKTIFGKILSSVAQPLKVIANVAVSPIEALTGKQIIGTNYDSEFLSKVDKATSGAVAAAGNVASGAVTGGLIKFKDPYVVAAEQEYLAQQQALLEQQAMQQQQQRSATEQTNNSSGSMLPILLIGGTALYFLTQGGK